MIDLLYALAKLEAVNTERTFIEINLARYFVSYVLGTTWDAKFIALGTKPDPWMLNANDAWLAKHPVAAPDLRRVTHFNRIIRLSDALFTLTMGKVDDFELLRQRFLQRKSELSSGTGALGGVSGGAAKGQASIGRGSSSSSIVSRASASRQNKEYGSAGIYRQFTLFSYLHRMMWGGT